MTETQVISLVEGQLPRIIQGTQGGMCLEIRNLDGEAIDLREWDSVTLACKNYPEADETISRTCAVADDDTPSFFCFEWSESESSGWLPAPYYAEVTCKRYIRDSEVTSSSTGFVPEKHFMTISHCLADFEVGDVITGASSNSTAVVYSIDVYGGEGELVLIKPSGAFTDGETITAPGGGTAQVVVGITSSEYLTDRFADADKDFVALGVKPKDEIVIGTDVYAVVGYDEVASDWLIVTPVNDSPGTGIAYVINTFNPASSATDVLMKTLPFVLYVDESLV